MFYLLGILITIMVSGPITAAILAYTNTKQPVIEEQSDQLLIEQYKLELTAWDVQFEKQTGKEPFPQRITYHVKAPNKRRRLTIPHQINAILQQESSSVPQLAEMADTEFSLAEVFKELEQEYHIAEMYRNQQEQSMVARNHKLYWKDTNVYW